MDPASSAVRAPVAHRAVSALAAPVLCLLIARLVLHYLALPGVPVQAAGVGLGAVLGLRAWSSRVDLAADSLAVRNTLATTTVPRDAIRRVNEAGRVEWRAGGARATRLPSEALRGPWWTFGHQAGTYAANRERVRAWMRAPASTEGATAAPLAEGAEQQADLDAGLDAELDAGRGADAATDESR